MGPPVHRSTGPGRTNRLAQRLKAKVEDIGAGAAERLRLGGAYLVRGNGEERAHM